VATKAEKANYRYIDFYSVMSLADFTEYIANDDADSTNAYQISSHSEMFS